MLPSQLAQYACTWQFSCVAILQLHHLPQQFLQLQHIYEILTLTVPCIGSSSVVLTCGGVLGLWLTAPLACAAGMFVGVGVEAAAAGATLGVAAAAAPDSRRCASRMSAALPGV